MKNLSLWGKNHKKMSYFIIIFSAIFLNTSFGIMGLSLEMDNINIPVFVTCALFVVLAITALLYPHKQKNSVNQADSYYNSYAKRKFCDFVMFSATALLALCLVNQESASLTIEENQENQLNSGIEQDNTVFRYVSNVEIPTETSTNTSTSTSAKTETSTQNTVSIFDEKKPTLAKSRKEMRKMLKKYIKEKGQMNTSAETVDILSKAMERLCAKGIDSAKADGRKTVMARDIVIDHL